MALNNTPLTWNNTTKFVPSKSEEKIMSTYDYLNNAENELRSALKSSVDLSDTVQLRKMVDTINTVEQIKQQYKISVTEDKKVQDGFFQRENYEELYGGYTADTIAFGTHIPGAGGNDHLILG